MYNKYSLPALFFCCIATTTVFADNCPTSLQQAISQKWTEIGQISANFNQFQQANWQSGGTIYCVYEATSPTPVPFATFVKEGFAQPQFGPGQPWQRNNPQGTQLVCRESLTACSFYPQ